MAKRDAAAPVVALTMGDPCGIGPEIIAKLATEITGQRRIIMVGDVDRLTRARQIVGASFAVHEIADVSDAVFEPGRLDVLQVGQLPADLPFGRIDAVAGHASFSYVEKALREAIAGHVGAIVTAPIHKEAWSAAGVDYPGHTELLAAACGIDDFAMMLFNDVLRVILVSIHVPLKQAVAMVTVERELRLIKLAQRAVQQLGIARPRIAVAGLNPHAGEGGQFGTEDGDIIAPAVALARNLGLDVTGPWPGDTVFMQARAGKFDIVVAQYHDQGLIPIKYLGIDNGVNVTVGLPFVRTSVDHGTAFDIAGTGVADPASLRQAIDHAVRMSTTR
jgi:4-hydroxythreonine-4-phosphate dehydrogenase